MQIRHSHVLGHFDRKSVASSFNRLTSNSIHCSSASFRVLWFLHGPPRAFQKNSHSKAVSLTNHMFFLVASLSFRPAAANLPNTTHMRNMSLCCLLLGIRIASSPILIHQPLFEQRPKTHMAGFWGGLSLFEVLAGPSAQCNLRKCGGRRPPPYISYFLQSRFNVTVSNGLSAAIWALG